MLFYLCKLIWGYIGKELIELFMALVSSFIFYLIIVYYPQKKANFHTNTFLIEKYKQVKIEIIQTIIFYLDRPVSKEDKIKENCLDYHYLRSLISDEDISTIRNLDEEEMKNLANEIYFHLSDLLIFLSMELSKSYIQENKEANDRISYLISWIDQYQYHLHSIDLNHEYDKYLRNYLQNFILGMEFTGYIPQDEFPRILHNAYKKTLYSHKVFLWSQCKKNS